MNNKNRTILVSLNGSLLYPIFNFAYKYYHFIGLNLIDNENTYSKKQKVTRKWKFNIL